jgi:hypothetical protein
MMNYGERKMENGHLDTFRCRSSSVCVLKLLVLDQNQSAQTYRDAAAEHTFDRLSTSLGDREIGCSFIIRHSSFHSGIARMRAKALKNRHIVLRGTVNGIKNYDALENGVPYEYKTVTTKTTNTRRRLEKAIYEGIGQAKNIVINWDREHGDYDLLKLVEIETKHPE